MAKSRPYHYLLIREDGRWGIQWGSYVKSEVVQERKDAYHQYKSVDWKIVTANERFDAEDDNINQIVSTMNGN